MQSLSSVIDPSNPIHTAKRKFIEPMPAKRAAAREPVDNGTFVMPLKQCFVKNHRIIDSTARMLTLLVGWAGKGTSIETTQGIIGRHVGKSTRTVQRMLNDAWREGYLTYAYTKNRIGMITGIRVFLRFQRLVKEKNVKISRKLDTTRMPDTNRNNYIYKGKDVDLLTALARIADTRGWEYPT